MPQTSRQKITISFNYWRVPSTERAFEGVLAGRLSEDQRTKRLAEVKEAREKWEPSDAAFALVAEIKSLIGETVEIQFWDPIMYWLEDEGPYPLRGVMRDVLILNDGEYPQAYVLIDHPSEIPKLKGFSPANFLQVRTGILGNLAPIAEVFEIRRT